MAIAMAEEPGPTGPHRRVAVSKLPRAGRRTVRWPIALGDGDLHRPVAVELPFGRDAVGHRGLRGIPRGAASGEDLGDALPGARRANAEAALGDPGTVLRTERAA